MFNTTKVTIATIVKIFSVYVFMFGYFFVSVEGLRCYQCNSHDDPTCEKIDKGRYSPHLLNCPENNGPAIYCRKIAFEIEYNQDKRIVRSCGYTSTDMKRMNKCFTADNEGYKEKICQCDSSECNSAPISFKQSLINLSIVSFTGLILSRLSLF